MLDLLYKDVIVDTLDAHIFDTHAVANSMLKRLLTSNTFMAPFAIFVKGKNDTAME